jgi:RNA polymerase sigma factor (sigma-70 family)
VSGRLGHAERALVAQAKGLVARYVRIFGSCWPGGGPDEVRSLVYDALMDSARRFDPARGTAFEAFAAPRVRGHLLRLLGREARVQSLLTLTTMSRPALEPTPPQSGLEAASATPADARAQAASWAARRAVFLSTAALLSPPPLQGDDLLAARQEYQHAVAVLRQAIGALEPHERHFVELYFERQWTHRQIADELGRSERTIERLHARVLDGLCRRLTDAGVEEPPPAEGRPPSEPGSAAASPSRICRSTPDEPQHQVRS